MLMGRAVLSAAFCACVVLAPHAVAAQSGSGDGYMFGVPGGSLTLRAGLARPNEQSDLFSFVRDELSVARGDFTGGSMSLDAAFFVRPQLAVQFGFGVASRTKASTYRHYVDNNDREIEQSSTLRRMPLSAGLRYYLTPPGRSISRLAWVPARVAPYVAAGGGITWYSFRQSGDFVDFQTLDVFHSTLQSTASSPSAFTAVGADYALGARVGLVGEARYDWASARLGSDFSGFNRIDLSGLAITLGLTYRY
ncbi:MAG: hypothetical protein HYV19_09960 [Gemmatimonadetes bacterium]|nr:hypothetical protein [Gemmatimonadota bacterium]